MGYGKISRSLEAQAVTESPTGDAVSSDIAAGVATDSQRLVEFMRATLQHCVHELRGKVDFLRHAAPSRRAEMSSKQKSRFFWQPFARTLPEPLPES